MTCSLSRLCCSSAVENLPSLQEALVQFPVRQKQHENLILLLLRIFWYNRDLASKSSVNRLQSYLKEQIKIKEALWGSGDWDALCSNRRGSLSNERYSVRNIPDMVCIEPSLVPCGLQHTFGFNYSLICFKCLWCLCSRFRTWRMERGDLIVPASDSRAETLPRAPLLGSVRERRRIGT